MWYIYAFITALLETSKDVVSRKSAQRTNEYISAFGLQFFACLTLLPFVVFTGIPKLSIGYWYGVGFAAISLPAWSILYMRALKLSPLSVTVPMLAFNPVFTALLAIFFEHRWPSVVGWLGIIIVAFGMYLMRLKRSELSKGIFHPIISIASEPGAIAMLGVAFIWSIGTYVNKIIIAGSSPLFFAFSITAVGSVVLYIVAKRMHGVTVRELSLHVRSMGPGGILNGLSEFAFGAALSLGFAPYVVSIKRMNVMLSAVVGHLAYKERISAVQLLGIMCMFGGLVTILNAQ